MNQTAKDFLRTMVQSLAIILRMVAYLIFLLTILLCFITGPSRIFFVQLAQGVSSFIPSVLSGIMVFNTPFGGAFRGDFVIFCACLMIVSWLLRIVSYRMR